LASCGTAVVEKTVSGTSYKGPFFTITQPDGFKVNEMDNSFTIVGKDYGIAIVANKSPNYKKDASQLISLGEEFKKLFEKPTVTKENFAGQQALYLESWKDGKMSFGYSFVLEGALITINASSVPQDKIEEASIVLHTFSLTNPDYFKPKPGDAEITQFGPSEGQPIQFGGLMLTPPKGWRILDNSTSDFISIEPREDNVEDKGQGINIIVLQGAQTTADEEALKSANKAGVQLSKVKIGETQYSTYTAQYQQMTFVYVTDAGDRQYWINISGPIDELTPKLVGFIKSLVFKKSS
ncbi:MAG: hypothetical protein HGA95_01620, partial [Caldiserica bacterium]|nr:hypothetical protein [Caldisericota bacterium]